MSYMAQIVLSIGVSLFVGLYSYQSSLIYPASLNDGHGYCATPDEYGMPGYELVNLKTEDGENLQCYSLKQNKESPTYSNKTIVVLSPNAGNIGHALPIVSMFYSNFGYNVFIYSYRGYGKSTGKPSEKGLKLDAQRIMQYLTIEDEQYQQSSIVLYGRSLGGAVGIYIASTMAPHIKGIILENTFLSIRKTVPHIFPMLRYLAVLIHQVWDSEKLVSTIPSNIPLLMLSARKDEIVPPEHMDRIFSLSKSDDKIMYKFENSSHNDTVIQSGYWEKIHDFVDNKVNTVSH
ncbi:DEHA2A14146p [Debaryomyces hansenii CBS767]|uniref:DEHA2A14146p n=1 Tax=Debaryomyces hansenii (strain ATCC 36239 / CBS 767 / BCRC 21394 / JCM 1990 / NBRC 0083 / IGC 2968) TaxID=284592 RepID=Q6BXX4_DEBHA|nr:DEHA2A14146p [Debaryomyces hansenii CBS767]CAG84923.2 DEHA2A14146p [Debaryomyces hansenii CBS767]|eukprot:XP_456945.2 DEHA2A14146p [Debaryomyces hansenii CBS767]